MREEKRERERERERKRKDSTIQDLAKLGGRIPLVEKVAPRFSRFITSRCQILFMIFTLGRM